MFKPKKAKDDSRRGRQVDNNGPPHGRGRSSTKSAQRFPRSSGVGGSSQSESVNSTDTAAQERLMRLQMDDLGTARRERLSTEDDPRNIIRVDHIALEAARESNIPGTEAYKLANKNRSALAGWAGLRKEVEATEASGEKLQDLGGGQSHRASLNARLAEAQALQNEYRRNPSKRARGHSRPDFQASSNSRRQFTPLASRPNHMPAAGHPHATSPLVPTNAGRGQIKKSYTRPSPQSDSGRGIVGARGRGGGHGSPRAGAVIPQVETLTRKLPGWTNRNVSTPEAFMDNLRHKRHLAPTTHDTSTAAKPIESVTSPVRSVSRAPQVTWTPTRSVSRLSQSTTLPTRSRSTSVSTRAESRPAPRPASQLISQPLFQSTILPTFQPIQPTTLSETTRDPISRSTAPPSIPEAADTRVSTPPPSQRRVLVPVSRQPRQPNTSAPSSSMFAPTLPANLLLDFEDSSACRMDQQIQTESATINYSELMGLEFKDPPLLDWSASVTLARQTQTPAEIEATMRAEALEFNLSRDKTPDQSLFTTYRSPPSSRESKKSNTCELPTPSCLSPKKGKDLDLACDLEKLCVSETSTPRSGTVPKSATHPKVVGNLRDSRWAEPRLRYHKLEDAESKVIGPSASLPPEYQARHRSIYIHPEKRVPSSKPKVKRLEPYNPSSKASTQPGQQAFNSTHPNDLSPPRVPPRVIGPAPGPVSVQSRRQDSLNWFHQLESRVVMLESQHAAVSENLPGKSKVKGLEPYNPSSKN